MGVELILFTPHKQVIDIPMLPKALYYRRDKSKYRGVITQESRRYTWQWNLFFLNLQSATLNVQTR